MEHILLVRHGATAGNLLKKYIGVTDEPLCRDGMESLRKDGALSDAVHRMMDAGRLVRIGVSPMLRCLQTAWIVTDRTDGQPNKTEYDGTGDHEIPGNAQELLDGIRAHVPGAQVLTEPQMRECDFGAFENKNYLELSSDERYQAWIDSGGTMTFPGGEDPARFRQRCCRAFETFAREVRSQGGDGLLVVHGGTIMSILEACAVDENGRPHGYYDWHVGNNGAYLFEMGASDTRMIARRINN